MSTLSYRRRRAAGFTIMELLVVIAIMALLASLTLMAFRYASISAMRNRTVAFSRGLESGLENYHRDNGEYPRPKRPAQTGTFGSNKTYNVGGALMLYQAMTGDGDTELELANSVLGASTGRLTDQEISRVAFKEMPKDLWKRDTAGYIVVDGFGHPFQYAAPNPNIKARYGAATTTAGAPETINTTYDLWSYGDDEQHTTQGTVDAKRSETISAKWIKNW